ncbi:unnamed protein product [Calicophoron daubneyi]|uniref:Exportin-2 n=1 Tax=Calicophoron daubneyi TaxID=300641 RepID=A0AAV2TXD7_CALDB
MNPEAVKELATNLQSTLSPDHAERKRAEAYLKTVELQPTYPLCLLALIQDASLPIHARQAGAIVFKNFIKTYWANDMDGIDRIQATDREGVRNQLIGAMLSVSGALQQQLSEAISTVWRSDFPQKWPNLIPELVQRMAQPGADLSTIHGVMQTAHILFKRYRHECRSDDLFREMKTVIEQFGVPLTELAKNLLSLVVGDQRITDATRLVGVFQCLLLVCKIFLSLNCQDLPEFFEDHIEEWMTIFRSLLQIDQSVMQLVDSAVVPGGGIWRGDGDSLSGGGSVLVEQVKSQVCDNASLYTSKYEEEFAPYLPGFVTDVWEMLMNTGGQAKYDMLIGNAIEFLSSVIARPPHRHLFENPDVLQKLCEKVILPNMHFRALDEELFADNPEEYLRLDLEGSDIHSRRRAACHLVHVLCDAFEGAVVTNFSTYVEHLLGEYASSTNGSAWVSKDAALLLVTSVAARGKTEKHGVTISTKLVNIVTFYENHVLPELKHPDVNHLPVIKADCMRYAIAFRSLLPPVALVELVNLVPHLLTAVAPVVYSYVAAMTDKLLAMRRPDSVQEPLITKDQISDPQLLIERLLAVLMLPDSMENVYVIRALMRTCCCLQERCLPSMNSLVSNLLSRLTQVAKNPCKPEFNHYLFETICLCIRITCATDPNSVVHFEAAFFPLFQEILQNDVSEFVPYVFQLLSVMLERYPLSQSVLNASKPRTLVNGTQPHTAPGSDLKPSPPYAALLPRLLVPSLWDQSGNVPSLSRLMQSYILHDMEEILSSNKLSAMLGVYQRLIGSPTYDTQAFAVLNALILATPKEVMQPYLRQIFVVIFRRLQASKTEKFLKAFAAFVARFTMVYSPNDLICLVDGMQVNLFGRVLEKVLLPFADAVISLPPNISGSARISESASSSSLYRSHWRQVSIGFIRLIGEANAMSPTGSSGSAPYRNSWAPLVGRIIAGLAAGPGRGGDPAVEAAIQAASQSVMGGGCVSNDERFIELDADLTSFSSGALLSYAVQRLPELAQDVPDPRIFLARTLHQLSTTNPGQIGPLLNSTLEPQLAAYLQLYLNQAQVVLA